METSILSSSQARLKLEILDKQAEAKNSYEFHIEMRALGLPEAVIEILEKIFKVSARISGKLLSIGKIVVIKLLEYVSQHPLQVAGLAVGLSSSYALGVALHGIFAWIPFLSEVPLIGWLLSKLAILLANRCKTFFVPLMFIIPVAGVMGGEILDAKYPEVSTSLNKVSKDFFELFSQIINSVKDELYFEDLSNSAFV